MAGVGLCVVEDDEDGIPVWLSEGSNVPGTGINEGKPVGVMLGIVVAIVGCCVGEGDVGASVGPKLGEPERDNDGMLLDCCTGSKEGISVDSDIDGATDWMPPDGFAVAIEGGIESWSVSLGVGASVESRTISVGTAVIAAGDGVAPLQFSGRSLDKSQIP